jgi:transcriptional regulator with XRE-family HTH domain
MCYNDDTMNTDLPDWLVRYQREHGWTMRQMALRFGIPPSTMHGIIHGRARADPATLRKIAAASHVTLDELLVLAGHRPEGRPTKDPSVDEVIALAEQMPPERRQQFWKLARQMALAIERLPEDGVPDVG